MVLVHMQRLPETADLVLAQLTARAALLKADGAIIDVSKGWKAFAAEGGLCLPDYGIGANYLKYCVFPEKSSIELLAGLQRVLHHEVDCFGTIYPCHSPAERYWYIMTAFPLAGSPARAAVVHYDVTALLRGTQAPSVALVGRGPAAADQAQDALARLVKRSIAEALAQSKSRLPEIGHEPRSAEHRAIARLTQREVELLRLLASGDSNAGIGQRLGISADAAKFRVVALTRKLGLKNRTQAAVFAARNGLVD